MAKRAGFAREGKVFAGETQAIEIIGREIRVIPVSQMFSMT
jgi:hypothetical protein